jgi:hypothetical protein
VVEIIPESSALKVAAQCDGVNRIEAFPTWPFGRDDNNILIRYASSQDGKGKEMAEGRIGKRILTNRKPKDSVNIHVLE